MIALILAASLAFADPDPQIDPPPVTVHPTEVGETVTVEAVLLEPVSSEEPIDTGAPTTDTDTPGLIKRALMAIYFLLGDLLLMVAGWFFIPAHQDLGAAGLFGVLVTGIIGELRLRLSRSPGRALDSMLAVTKPSRMGSVDERRMRELLDERVTELSNLQRTQISVLREALTRYIEAEQVDDMLVLAQQTPNHPGLP